MLELLEGLKYYLISGLSIGIVVLVVSIILVIIGLCIKRKGE